ncbi:MAG: hypothetical protein EAX86_07390 [Candidatus Heimdallarchaeota archaeon]|nr:hypothetical protein [Candidatus Heimdallarchaeota archaeon]
MIKFHIIFFHHKNGGGQKWRKIHKQMWNHINRLGKRRIILEKRVKGMAVCYEHKSKINKQEPFLSSFK